LYINIVHHNCLKEEIQESKWQIEHMLKSLPTALCA
jgi:hypothetical protein